MWLVPLQVDVRHPAMDQDEIERAIAYHLVRDAQVTAARVPSLRPHAIRLGLARLSSACFPFSDGARRLQGAIEGEVDETLQNASAEWAHRARAHAERWVRGSPQPAGQRPSRNADLLCESTLQLGARQHRAVRARSARPSR